MENPYLAYTRQYLVEHGADRNTPGQRFRSRAEHIARVAMWLERLMVQGDVETPEALRLAVAFHDVGYARGVEDHAAHSADILREYAACQGLDAALVEQAAFLVAEHSNKARWLGAPDAPRDLVLLMEADLLDEEGAMGLARDCLMAGENGAGGYEDAYDRMRRYEPPRLARYPMVTPLARQFWAEKQQIIRTFLQAFAFDLGVTPATEDGGDGA